MKKNWWSWFSFYYASLFPIEGMIYSNYMHVKQVIIVKVPETLDSAE